MDMFSYRVHEGPGRRFSRVAVVIRQGLEVEIVISDCNAKPIPVRVSVPGLSLSAEDALSLSHAISQCVGLALATQEQWFHAAIAK